ncbi:MAG: diguanylate cyclase domain-containing protein, partial [Alphaproteobacteria bacterium]
TAGASVGIAVYPEHANDGTSLTHHADAAMYRAKKNDELFAIYNPEEIALSAHS